MRVRKCLSQHTQRASVISRPTARQTVKAKLSVKVRGRKTTKQKLKLMYYQTRCDHHHHQVQLLCVVQRLYIVQCRKKLNWHSSTQWKKERRERSWPRSERCQNYLLYYQSISAAQKAKVREREGDQDQKKRPHRHYLPSWAHLTTSTTTTITTSITFFTISHPSIGRIGHTISKLSISSTAQQATADCPADS